MIGGREIQARPTEPQRHQHERWPGLILEVAHHTGTVTGAAIQAREGYAGSAEMGFDTIQEGGPL